MSPTNPQHPLQALVAFIDFLVACLERRAAEGWLWHRWRNRAARLQMAQLRAGLADLVETTAANWQRELAEIAKLRESTDPADQARLREWEANQARQAEAIRAWAAKAEVMANLPPGTPTQTRTKPNPEPARKPRPRTEPAPPPQTEPQAKAQAEPAAAPESPPSDKNRERAPRPAFPRRRPGPARRRATSRPIPRHRPRLRKNPAPPKPLRAP